MEIGESNPVLQGKNQARKSPASLSHHASPTNIPPPPHPPRPTQHKPGGCYLRPQPPLETLGKKIEPQLEQVELEGMVRLHHASVPDKPSLRQVSVRGNRRRGCRGGGGGCAGRHRGRARLVSDEIEPEFPGGQTTERRCVCRVATVVLWIGACCDGGIPFFGYFFPNDGAP